MAITDAMKKAVLGLTSDEVAISLLTFSGTGFTTFRVCNNDTDIVSRSQTFLAWPFDLQLPGDNEDAPAAVLRIANVDRRIGQGIDAAAGPINVLIEVILASNPDNPEKTFQGLELRTTRRNGLVIEGELQSAQITSEPYPNIRATPGRFPGLFPVILLGLFFLGAIPC